MRVADMHVRYRLTLPPGSTFSDYAFDPAMEWVRLQSARAVAKEILRYHPDLIFTIEQARAYGPSRTEWRAVWWSPQATRSHNTIWSRFRRAVALFRGEM